MAKARRIRFRIDFDNGFQVGPGKIALLEAISESGSLSAAARSLGMSYRRAWLLLDSLNNTFEKPTTVNTAGGAGGGGAALTDFGNLVIERYRQLDQAINEIGATYLKDLEPHLSQSSKKSVVKRSIVAKPERPR